MSDDVRCTHCGDTFSLQGISTHERYCGPDESEVESEPTNTRDNYSELEVGTSSAGVLRSQSELRLEQEAIDRDDGACLECGSEDELTVHVVDPDD